jgi:hypothetical protein
VEEAEVLLLPELQLQETIQAAHLGRQHQQAAAAVAVQEEAFRAVRTEIRRAAAVAVASEAFSEQIHLETVE